MLSKFLFSSPSLSFKSLKSTLRQDCRRYLTSHNYSLNSGSTYRDNKKVAEVAYKKRDVPIDDLKKLLVTIIKNQGYNLNDAKVIADVLLYAELRGNNQGIIKLINGALTPSSTSTHVSTVFETPISAKLDGGQVSGMVVLSQAVKLAICKAESNLVGIVGCSNYSSATGALGIWARTISNEGYISIVMSQCNELVAPHGSYEPIFGTNPLAIGVPTRPRSQVLDMATSAAAYFGLVTAKEAGRSIASDIAYDASGFPTTDPSEAILGALRVFDRSFKGSHIALMIELLAGAFTGAAMENKLNSKNWGSLIIAINPAVFGPDCLASFQENAAIMCERVKNAKKLPDSQDIIHLPGERGDQLEAENLAKGTLQLSESQYESLRQMCISTVHFKQ